MKASPRELINKHLATHLGQWPPTDRLVVTSSSGRSEPGWDGSLLPVAGISSPYGTVVSVPPNEVAEMGKMAREGGFAALERGLLSLVPFPRPRLMVSQFRWCECAPDVPDAGRWVNPRADAVPTWLGRYQEALVADGESGYLGAIGIKHHDEFAHEVAIQVDIRACVKEAKRDVTRGLAAQACRKLLDEGVVPIALLRSTNARSVKLCDDTKFLDRGWRYISVVSG